MSKNEECKVVTENSRSICGKLSFLLFILPFSLAIGLSIFGEIISAILIFNLLNLSNLGGDDIIAITFAINSVRIIFMELSIYFCPLGIILALIGLYNNTPRELAIYGLLGNIFLFYISNK